jgi:hypothetical protein
MTEPMAVVDTAAVAKKIDTAQPPADGVDAELVARLVEQARAAGVQLTGESALLQQLTKRVLESALEGEIRPPRLRPGRRRSRDRLESSQRGAGQDRADRGRPGRDRRAPRPGRQLRTADHP